MSYYQGKRVLITGAGSGLGALMAEQLGRRGAEVIVTARRRKPAEDVCRRVQAAGGRGHALLLDVGDLDAIPAFRDEVHSRVGPVDILINNAGVVFGGEFEQVDLAQHLNTLQINTLGLIAMSHAFMGDLRDATQGHLVNIASASAYVGLPWGSTYAASKWAVLGFSESLRLELRERGIDNVAVTTVCPSYISTGMFDGVRSPLLSPMLTPDKVVKSILRGVKRGEAMVSEPAIVKSIDLIKGALPLRLWDEVARRSGLSTSMKHWQGK
ncbi:SDR family NAD(P)-dependent oxidoreductase [Isoalcanivorax indicus]|uniref:SDR family NAD(P)-dependent oxidoreductase n=1 Tax=Isoalcanivorax indicus TaxID=2202653 RepID=UPI000DBA8B98|nr:SDR family NAD(P)-dependent oxidoreductase [Isoalcanivorax indicus]